MRRSQTISDLRRESSRQRKRQVQRSWGNNELGVFQGPKEGSCTSSPVTGMEPGDAPRVEG